MKEIKLGLDKNKKYVIACSFGPDSMALLSSAIQDKLNIVVAHVNYHKREVSNDEQKALTKYCDEHKIKIYVLDLLNEKSKGNFQEWAREKRYSFFADVLKKENADCVLVAHQQDDVIETYLMQKKRGNFAQFAGISKENELFGVKVLRPLLDYSKAFLQSYDEEKNVPYSIDESNLTDHYTRNIFRHHIVQKLTEQEREKILLEIMAINKNKIKEKNNYTKEEFLFADYGEIITTLNKIMNKCDEHRDLSRAFIEEIKKAFKHKSTHRVQITKSFFIELDYGDVYFVNQSKLKAYKLTFENKFKNDFIELDFSKGTEDRNINLTNTKLIIKNCNKNDEIIIKNYSAKIRRLFIDWKMPLFLREIWPGIYNEKEQLLYVPRYKKTFVDKHSSKFIIDTKYFQEF